MRETFATTLYDNGITHVDMVIRMKDRRYEAVVYRHILTFCNYYLEDDYYLCSYIPWNDRFGVLTKPHMGTDCIWESGIDADWCEFRQSLENGMKECNEEWKEKIELLGMIMDDMLVRCGV